MKALDLALFSVTVGGKNISEAFVPIGKRISIRNGSGAETDTAEIEIYDLDPPMVFPRRGVSIEISLTDARGAGIVFRGAVDGVRSRGGRGGREMTISAKGADVAGSTAEPRDRHWDDTTLATVLDQAARDAGLEGAKVDPAFAGENLDYVAQQSESFLAFGQRLAREVGGTFKVSGQQALLLKRGGGVSASGKALPSIIVERGVNLIDWDIAPDIGRAAYGAAAVKVYNPATGEFEAHTANSPKGRQGRTHQTRWPAASSSDARRRASADAAEGDRNAGSGSVGMMGDVRAQPEAELILKGVRPGIDGVYRIKTVEHSLDRGGGVATRCEVGEPAGGAGVDDRAG